MTLRNHSVINGLNTLPRSSEATSPQWLAGAKAGDAQNSLQSAPTDDRSGSVDRPPTAGWDLHCHTVFSDGTKSPAELLSQAKALGLHGVAITDHDTSSGWVQAEVESHRLGVPLVRGTEITTDDRGTSVHLLAYQYNSGNEAVANMLAAIRQSRMERAKAMVRRLSKDYPISWEDVTAQVKQGDLTTIGRPHMADALVAAGVYPNRSAAFQGSVSSRSVYYIPTTSPTTTQAIAAVSNAGGVSVIAHAGDRNRNRLLLNDQRIEAFVEEGLAGLEVWHRGNQPDQRRRLLSLCHQYGLLITGGSDWHGQGKPNALGENLTDDWTVAQIVSRGVIPLAQ